MTTEQQPETPAPSRRRGATLALVALLSVALGSGGTWLLTRPADGHDHGGAGEAATRYQCPMHPTIVQDHPGDCPICGMKLVSMAAPGGAAPAAAQPHYQCPMHPSAQGDHPGDCHICGMKLEKLTESGEFELQPGDRKIVFYRSPMDPTQTSHEPRKDEMGMDYLPVYLDELQGAPPVQGLVTVKIDPARQQLIGLVTAPATTGQISATLRTTGRVAVDETRVHRVNVKYGGYVERVQADFVGQRVARGQPLFTIYSPELLTAQEELLLALRTQRGLSAAPGLGEGAAGLVAAARRKLELWDVPPATVARLEQTGQAERTLTVFSPATGVVIRKDVVPGQRLEAGAMPYEVWDLSTIWVLADVYETELRHVKVGAPATLTLKAFPGLEHRGRVAFVDPVLDPKTRTVKVRLAFENASGALKPEMFGEVVLGTPPRKALRIPADALIDSGTRSVVFVALGDGKFQPRVVRPGASDGDQVEIIDGLGEGELVVTRANFLVDSESRLKASLQALAGGAAP
ncbi:MAG: efflux RND transporter periplasmic adaptor subunit [Anaeromyxobacteraceae bacterium]|nr:efflux RND transporter periplasmic adaptor subunit [Anaeromyxobacteraceae bacterium]